MSWYSSGGLSDLLAIEPRATVSFDVETTGVSRYDEILQLAIVRGDGAVLMNERFCPDRHTSWKSAERVHGIGPSDVVGARKLWEARLGIQALFDNASLIVGYNLPFDMGFLRRASIIFHSCFAFDVMREFAPVANVRHGASYRWRTLGECARHYGVSFHAHDALEDAQATLECYRRMLGDDGSRYGNARTVPYLTVAGR